MGREFLDSNIIIFKELRCLAGQKKELSSVNSARICRAGLERGKLDREVAKPCAGVHLYMQALSRCMAVQNNHTEGPGSSQSNSSQSPRIAPVLSTEGGRPVVFIGIEQ